LGWHVENLPHEAAQGRQLIGRFAPLLPHHAGILLQYNVTILRICRD
jgi:hypothetical protein